MNDPILDSIVFLMKYRRAPLEATAAFRRMKHNADLLPKLQLKLELVLQALGRFREVIYDTQGIRDDGVDALVRIPVPDEEGAPELIGFQVKSFHDMEIAGYLKDLKAQHSDAVRKAAGLTHYFILLCTDPIKHRERIRSVEAEFKSTPKVEVIEPQFVYTFLEHPETLIDAVVKRMVESRDPVFRDAVAEVAAFDSPSVRALVIYLVVESILNRRFEFRLEDLLRDRILEDVYSELREKQQKQLEAYTARQATKTARPTDETPDDESEQYDEEDEDDWDEGDEDEGDWDEEDEDDFEPEQILEFEQQLTVDIDSEDTSLLRHDPNTGILHFQSGDLPALLAVIADAVARFLYNRDELMNFAFDVMGIRD